jgi:hypothetical protein
MNCTYSLFDKAFREFMVEQDGDNSCRSIFKHGLFLRITVPDKAIGKDKIMIRRTRLFGIALFASFFAATVFAQMLIPIGHYLLPTNPTPADNLKLSLADQTCGGILRYTGNPYRVSMLQNNITVTLGERLLQPVPTCPPPPGREEIDLGRLPAGNYTLSVIDAQTGINPPSGAVFSNVPFSVADARLTKSAPYVRLDYSGHWWDPSDSGWGLFIWQDARSSVDSVLAAWFTYTPDGKPMWYVFQPAWQTTSSTFEVPLMQTSRLPSTMSPPPNPTAITFAGTVSLDFTNFGTADEGKLTYTFTGGAKQTRTIQRFKP